MSKTTPKRADVITEIKNFLEKEHNLLEQRLQNAAQSGEPLLEEKEDIDASVQLMAEASVQKTVDINLEKQLRDIKKALKRIEDGIYGTCKYCDQDIFEGRLKARPTSTSCVSCKKTLTHEQ